MRKMTDVLLNLGRILLILAGVYAVLAIGAHYLSLRMIFPRPPVKYSPGPDYLELSTADGVKIAARYWPNPGAKYTLLYLHGNYEELGSIGEYIPSFLKAGYAVFVFDYRGYGHSGGTPSETNVYADTQLAYDYLRDKLGIPANRIIPFGYSLGGGPAVELALHNPVPGLVLQGSFVSAYRVLTRIPVFPGDKFENLRKISKLTCPVMIIHGTADGTVPFWHGKQLYESIAARKAKLLIEGGPHSGLADFAGPRYWEDLQRFTNSL